MSTHLACWYDAFEGWRKTLHYPLFRNDLIIAPSSNLLSLLAVPGFYIIMPEPSRLPSAAHVPEEVRRFAGPHPLEGCQSQWMSVGKFGQPLGNFRQHFLQAEGILLGCESALAWVPVQATCLPKLCFQSSFIGSVLSDGEVPSLTPGRPLSKHTRLSWTHRSRRTTCWYDWMWLIGKEPDI